MKTAKPTIKGIFAKSHLNAVQRHLGENGLLELERRLGKKIIIKNSDNILISEEVKIIEIVLELLTNKHYTQDELAYEAGKLHFYNFCETPFGKIIFSVFRNNFKLMMLQAKNIAGHVFNGVIFSTEELEPSALNVVTENNDYPLKHFQGLFQAWMEFSGLSGRVDAIQTGADRYEYHMKWAENG